MLDKTDLIHITIVLVLFGAVVFWHFRSPEQPVSKPAKVATVQKTEATKSASNGNKGVLKSNPVPENKKYGA
jgi:pseudouridine-5'-phosphate glycosidase